MILLWTTPPPPQASPLHGAQLTVDTSNWDQRLLRCRGADSRPPMSIQPHNRTARTTSARPANKSIPGATNVNMMECQSAPACPGGRLSRRNTNPDVGVPVRGGMKPPEVAMAVRGGTETPGVNAPIFEGHDDANDRFSACEKGTIHPETTGGHCKKKTKGGSSRRIKEGDVVSCASTEFDGDQPGSWSDGKKDRTHGVVTHISKEGIVMVHWYDDNTNFAVKMKNLRREAEKAPEAISRSPTTVSNEKSATANRPNADFASDKERQAGRGRKRDRSGRNQSGRKQVRNQSGRKRGVRDQSGRKQARSGRKQVRDQSGRKKQDRRGRNQRDRPKPNHRTNVKAPLTDEATFTLAGDVGRRGAGRRAPGDSSRATSQQTRPPRLPLPGATSGISTFNSDTADADEEPMPTSHPDISALREYKKDHTAALMLYHHRSGLAREYEDDMSQLQVCDAVPPGVKVRPLSPHIPTSTFHSLCCCCCATAHTTPLPSRPSSSPSSPPSFLPSDTPLNSRTRSALFSLLPPNKLP